MNNQFLKDLFQACMMQDVEYLTIAVKNEYMVNNKKTGKVDKKLDFDEVLKFFDALYSNNRLILPLHGILIIALAIPMLFFVNTSRQGIYKGT